MTGPLPAVVAGRATSTPVVLFGWLSLLGALGFGLGPFTLIAAPLVPVGVIGALLSAGTNRRAVGAWCAVQGAGVLMVAGAVLSTDYNLAVMIVLAGKIVVLAGAIGVVVCGHRVPVGPGHRQRSRGARAALITGYVVLAAPALFLLWIMIRRYL